MSLSIAIIEKLVEYQLANRAISHNYNKGTVARFREEMTAERVAHAYDLLLEPDHDRLGYER